MENQESAKPDLAKFGITVESEFVPWHRSRSAKKDPQLSDYNLNWVVTLCVNGRPIITADYSAGYGHCPANKVTAVPASCPVSLKQAKREMIIWECENGRQARWNWTGPGVASHAKKLEPGAESVVYSLLMDSDVLDYRDFADWAESIGYDSDSIKALDTYRACLDIGLKMRNGLGEKVLAELREQFQDF